ncbi:undecaprenyl-diphosphate phosphatase [Pontibacter akesuensis]|uniref:Undecaprenyl-diphosphatase n=1 Tax=Pontibacter akesuensis TaxID=388950 RepID=A0A1I7GAZ8_9BACT|nr:undecaprenyl-diphosphate phosphatase [Pontibacter akesuensis]GHA57691.1 undecaprenyl-diphosphatase [Pontibacter akesuensis]SFU45630.1 Undecaprenyl-diphosphatase [Pontibacter akesuensis]
MSVWQAIILAIVEGLTEFLPVSSTGHMIIASSLMGINELPITKVFEVNIQFGAILSVVVLYWRRFLQSFNFYTKLLVAFIPAVVFGLAFKEVVDAMLESVVVTAIMLVLGGIVLLFVDKWFRHSDKEEITYKNAVVIGLFQCIAMIPGVSRSAASIIGGLAQGVDRKTAAEFSFFLAVPTMLAAASYKFVEDLLKLEISDVLKLDIEKIQNSFAAIDPNDIQLLLIGNVVAFVVAMLAIRFFINFLTKYGFKMFGYYRIALGVVLLTLLAMGYELTV